MRGSTDEPTTTRARASAIALFCAATELGCEDAARAAAGGFRALAMVALAIAIAAAVVEIGGALLVVAGALANRRVLLGAGLALSCVALSVHLPAALRSVLDGRIDPIVYTCLLPFAATCAGILTFALSTPEAPRGSRALLFSLGAATFAGAGLFALSVRASRSSEALPPSVTQVAIGRSHTCVLLDDGSSQPWNAPLSNTHVLAHWPGPCGLSRKAPPGGGLIDRA